MRISDWSSDVCSSDLLGGRPQAPPVPRGTSRHCGRTGDLERLSQPIEAGGRYCDHAGAPARRTIGDPQADRLCAGIVCGADILRSEEHTSELQSLMRISYAVFCLKTKT